MIDLVDVLDRVSFPFEMTDIRILFVVDGPIRTVEKPGAFGVGRVVRLIDNLSRGGITFTAHTARRAPYPFPDSPENLGHVSTSFRFDAMAGNKPVIDGYDQIWLFGYEGEVSGTPLSDPAELAALVAWMNRGGGLFATGDHADLGASLCSGIPRVREMRRWRNVDGVPPSDGPERLDTNRPTNADEASGIVPMTFEHERDGTPQQIEWIPVTRLHPGQTGFDSPHEVLYHPVLGPIDVMPDHPHEGRTKTVTETDLARTYNFGAGDEFDFPSTNGSQPLPTVIAQGRTFPSPPTDKAYKGPADLIEFPMITVYDGRAAGVGGRVVVDSTWHHWFDLNLFGLEHAAENTAWRKISRYFENVAVWLAPPGQFNMRNWLARVWLEYPLVEEFDLRRLEPDAITPDLGRMVRDRMRSVFGPTATTRFVWDAVGELAPEMRGALERLVPEPAGEPRAEAARPAGLTSPPSPLLEQTVLGGMALATVPFLESLASGANRAARREGAQVDREFDTFLSEGIIRSLRTFGVDVVGSLEQDLDAWRRVARR